MSTIVLSLLYADIATSPDFIAVMHPQTCCDTCTCLGYDAEQQALVHQCGVCQQLQYDHLPFTPLFAQPLLDRLAHQHYQIACPYCQDIATLVGGTPQEGFYFVCDSRCHQSFTRAIRRF